MPQEGLELLRKLGNELWIAIRRQEGRGVPRVVVAARQVEDGGRGDPVQPVHDDQAAGSDDPAGVVQELLRDRDHVRGPRHDQDVARVAGQVFEVVEVSALHARLAGELVQKSCRDVRSGPNRSRTRLDPGIHSRTGQHPQVEPGALCRPSAARCPDRPSYRSRAARSQAKYGRSETPKGLLLGELQAVASAVGRARGQEGRGAPHRLDTTGRQLREGKVGELGRFSDAVERDVVVHGKLCSRVEHDWAPPVKENRGAGALIGRQAAPGQGGGWTDIIADNRPRGDPQAIDRSCRP